MSLLTIVTVVKDDTVGFTETMESIAQQESDDVSVLVMDSSLNHEAIPDLIREFPQLAIAYHWTPPTGVYGAMNASLPFVESDFVYFLNAGDVFAKPDVLNRLVTELSDAEPEWAFGRVHFYSESGAALHEEPWSYQAERARLFARGHFPAHQGVVVRTEALRDQGGFDARYAVTADYASILKLARDSDPLILDFPIAVFRQGGLSTAKWRTGLRDFHVAREEVFDPRGWARWQELLDTWWLGFKTYAYHGIERFRAH